MPKTTADHISITFRGVEDLAAFRRRRKVEAVTPHLLDPLRRRGDVSQHFDEADEAEVWREAARLAGRRLGVHVRTGRTRCVCPDREGVHVWAVNLDVEVSEAEVRAAINRAAALVDGSPGMSRRRRPSPLPAPQPPLADPGGDGRSGRA